MELGLRVNLYYNMDNIVLKLNQYWENVYLYI